MQESMGSAFPAAVVVRHRTAQTSARWSRGAELGTAARVFPSLRCWALAERWDVPEFVGGRPSLGVVGCVSRLLRNRRGVARSAAECRGPSLGVLRRGIGSEAGCELRLGRAARSGGPIVLTAARIPARMAASHDGWGTEVCGCDRLRGAGARRRGLSATGARSCRGAGRCGVVGRGGGGRGGGAGWC